MENACGKLLSDGINKTMLDALVRENKINEKGFCNSHRFGQAVLRARAA
jgi:hypothetical protein